ncbi:MAG: hypothetical protein QOH21_3458 [Acidobacteriota bacterium]|nr:hypothetical protein [Acidobacteriota bacterium]
MPNPFPFRNRAHEVTRVEAFSDIVFGFALTLIVVSLEVPKTFEELMHEMRGFIGFAICFGILMWVWFAHHTFFRRYGMTDGITIVINTCLLFVVLFYVYPLKFTFALVTRNLAPGAIRSEHAAATLMVIYGLGFFALFLVFFLLYGHAYRRRELLELNGVEVHDTVTHLIMYATYMAIGLLATLVAIVFPDAPQWSGFTFFLLGPVSAVIGGRRGAKRRKIEELSMAEAT